MSTLQDTIRRCESAASLVEDLNRSIVILCKDCVARADRCGSAGLWALRQDYATCAQELSDALDLCDVAGFAFRNCQADLIRLEHEADGDAIDATILAFERLLRCYRELFREFLTSTFRPMLPVMDRATLPWNRPIDRSPKVRSVTQQLTEVTTTLTSTESALMELLDAVHAARAS